jgi:EmrB/QacA subfamily drug resistance transporter
MTIAALSVESRPAQTLWVTALGILLCFVNASTLNVALPVVAREVHASPLQASWILLIYMLVASVLILVFGRVGDLLGRRNIYLAGLVLLTVASVGCAVAWNIHSLLVMRALQAVGAAAIITNTSALIADVFPRSRLAAGLGTIATISALAQGLGPLMGGALVEWLGWRVLFWLNLPLGAIGIWAAYRVLDRTPKGSGGSFDWIGTLLSALAIGGWVYGLSMGGVYGWTDARVISALCTGSVGGLAFVISQKYLTQPLLDLSLFKDRTRAIAYVGILLVCMAQTASIVLAALFLQGVQGLDTATAGLHVVPLAIGMAVGSAVSVRWLRVSSATTVAGNGSALCALGLGLIAATLGPQTSSVVLGGGLLLTGLGLGTFIPPNTSTIMTGVSSELRGVCNGVRSTAMNLGFLLGAACSLTLATMDLLPEAQRAAFAGELRALASVQITIFINGCIQVFSILALLCAGVAILMWRVARR